MPAPVPPGYTRGSIVFLGASADPAQDESLQQWLWREAGGYGARIVFITAEAAQTQRLSAVRDRFAAWECDQVGEIVALDRTTARNPVHSTQVEQATGIVLLGDDPRHMAATLGGTPLAQTIRRANARSKLVAGFGAASAFLCQHIISPFPQATTLRNRVAFAPGLGLVNRLVVDANVPSQGGDAQTHLFAAVASNPFLIGVNVPPGSAAILYSDNTLQANGHGAVMIVDGQEISAADLDAVDGAAIEGALRYTLHAGDGFNLDDLSLRPVGEIDLPPTGPVTSVF